MPATVAANLEGPAIWSSISPIFYRIAVTLQMCLICANTAIEREECQGVQIGGYSRAAVVGIVLIAQPGFVV
jgi:hypothetical protein